MTAACAIVTLAAMPSRFILPSIDATAWRRRRLFALVLANTVIATGTMAAPPDMREAIRAMTVASPYRIPGAARAREIRYRLTSPQAAQWSWPTTGEQRVRRIDGAVEITVCADCGDEAPSDAATLAALLRPNRYVDSRDRDVTRFARRHARSVGVDARMRALVEAVRQHMDGPIRYDDYAPASRALATRSGDCTESAVLLAASARAIGIPARVVYGLAYASRFVAMPHAFGPHVWMQAWDGTRWRSYDAGLGRFDAGHIAVHVDDGSLDGAPDVAGLLRSLRIEDAAVIERRGNRTPRVDTAQ